MKSQPIFRQKCALHVVTSHDIFYSFCPCLLAAYQYTLTTIVLLINRDALVVSKTATKICKLAKATYPSSKDNSDANGNTFYVPLVGQFQMLRPFDTSSMFNISFNCYRDKSASGLSKPL